MIIELNQTRNGGHLDFIDGLRGIAILAVLLAHSYYFLLGDNFGKFKFYFSGGVLDAGQRGVQLFFILSAFTLFNSSFRRFKQDKYPKINFYIRRFFRIIPFYWIILFIWIVIQKPQLNSIFASIFFYFGFLPNASVVPGAWTLFVEETFYLFLPLIFRFAKNIRMAIIFTGALLGLSLFNPIYNFLLNNPDQSLIFNSPLKQWWCFGLGIILFYLYNSASKNQTGKIPFISLFFIFSFIISLKLGYYFQVISLTFLFICSFYSNNLIGKFTRNKLLGKFGIYCYSIYLTHFVTINILEHFSINLAINNIFTQFPSEIKVLVAFLILSSISFLISSITFKFIEKPFIDFGKKMITTINEKMQFKSNNPLVKENDLTA